MTEIQALLLIKAILEAAEYSRHRIYLGGRL